MPQGLHSIIWSRIGSWWLGWWSQIRSSGGSNRFKIDSMWCDIIVLMIFEKHISTHSVGKHIFIVHSICEVICDQAHINVSFQDWRRSWYSRIVFSELYTGKVTCSLMLLKTIEATDTDGMYVLFDRSINYIRSGGTGYWCVFKSYWNA